jgi:hypothetical protein
MSTLSLETWQMPAADLGPDNPLPPLQASEELHAPDMAMPNIPDAMIRNMTYGRISTILPYTLQDRYNRARAMRDFRVAVLENEILKAVFLLELGGRLWSLLHKPSGHELLKVNPVFQPANLALRNAWFAGGIEWNIGMTGHSPLTCSPIFAAEVEGPQGTPILRMYEWERIRQVSYQIDAYLPDGSPMLLLHFRIVNPHSHDVPMYWWSNIAVPQMPDTRVVVPASSAYRFGYTAGLEISPVPYKAGQDISYATTIQRTVDYFFRLPEGQRPWIAALDGQGKGLVQVSTSRLKGRKLFMWGMGTSGHNWQTFLSEPGHAYLEIQAGLATTQLERLPMPAGASWTWLEGYGMVETDPADVHGPDWTRAREAVGNSLEHLAPRATFETQFQAASAFIDKRPTRMLHHGSGWGVLERLRREKAGEPSFCGEALTFDEAALGEAQHPWLVLLTDGVFHSPAPQVEPTTYMIQDEWRSLLERAAEKAPNWFVWLHLGVMYYAVGEIPDAREAWEYSLSAQMNAWALRNLGVLARREKRWHSAIALYSAAHALRPALLPLAIEMGQVLIDAGRSQDWLDMLSDLSEAHRTAGRVRLLEGQAALVVRDFARLEKLFSTPFTVDDFREGERSLSDLWFRFQEDRLSSAENVPIDDTLRRRVRQDYPLPRDFDFRMTSEEGEQD